MNAGLMERDRGSQVAAGAATETAGIPGATLQRLHDGLFLLTESIETPPDPVEVRALLLEFLPADWVCLERESEEDYDLAYYGPDGSQPHVPCIPHPRRAS